MSFLNSFGFFGRIFYGKVDIKNGPFFYSTYFTSIWLWLYVVAGLVVKTHTRLGGALKAVMGILDVKDDQTLITSVIFRYIHHPIYAGGVVGIFGFYLAFRSPFVLIAVWIIYFIVFRHRLHFEEKMMIEAFGDEYREYMKRTKRLIPFLY